MKQLTALTDFITRLDLVAAEDVDGWVQDITQIQPLITDKGPGGINLYRMTYTAVFLLDNFPHKRISPLELFAQVIAWLHENDSDRVDGDDAPLRTSIDIYDDRAAEVEISIDFVEDVGIVLDANGRIFLGGQRYSLAEPEIWYALEGDLAEPVDLDLGAILKAEVADEFS